MTTYGIQLYSLRDMAANDLEGALQTVAALGYRSVEFAGFFGHPAKKVRQWLDRWDLVCCGTHTSIDLLDPGVIDETIAYHRALGCDSLIVPAADWETEEKMKANIARLNAAQRKLQENGITLGYHNHSREFFPTPYGKTVMDEILSKTEVQLEPDTFWLFNAGIDPVAFLDAHRDRIHVIHVKDGLPAAPENRNYAHTHDGVKGTALGEGEAPVKSVCAWAVEHGVRMVVESEGLDPTGAEEVGRCIRFLHSLD